MQTEKLQRFEKISGILDGYEDSKRYHYSDNNANFYWEEIETIQYLDKNKIIIIVLTDRPHHEIPIALLNPMDHCTVRGYLKKRIDQHNRRERHYARRS